MVTYHSQGFVKTHKGRGHPCRVEAFCISYGLSALLCGASCSWGWEERPRGPEVGERSLEPWLGSEPAASATGHQCTTPTRAEGQDSLLRHTSRGVSRLQRRLDKDKRSFFDRHNFRTRATFLHYTLLSQNVRERSPVQAARSLDQECRSLEGTFQKERKPRRPQRRMRPPRC